MGRAAEPVCEDVLVLERALEFNARVEEAWEMRQKMSAVKS